MRKKFIILCFSIIVQNGFAQLVDIETAKKVASNFFSTKKSIASNKIKDVLTEATDNEIIFYVINFSDGGWVLLSASYSTWPILAYGIQGEFRLDDDKPEQLNSLLDNYKEQIKAVRFLKTANINVSEKWSTLQIGSSLKSLKSYSPGTVLLNIPSRGGEVKWGQGANNGRGCNPSYNEQCPSNDDSDCNCGHEPVGCGAVAMGQIMWKWQWPQTYNWSQMDTELKENDNDAIPRLLSDCGRKADMHYGCSGSWAYINKLVDAFKDFNYKGVEKREKKDWPNDVWIQMIRNEIDCERPVLYSVS